MDWEYLAEQADRVVTILGSCARGVLYVLGAAALGRYMGWW